MAFQIDAMLVPLILQLKEVVHCFTPQPNRSKIFELQQSNQGYGESKGVEDVQKNAKQKKIFHRAVSKNSHPEVPEIHDPVWRYLGRYIEERL